MKPLRLNADGCYEHLSEDNAFFRRAIAAGYDVWCDWHLSQQVKHIGTHDYSVHEIETMPTYNIGQQ